MTPAAGQPDDALEGALRRCVQQALGARVTRIEPAGGGLGRRRFFRLSLAPGPPARAIARVEAPEDPARRPPGVPPEPALEPLRSFLEDAGLPVPARLGGDAAAGIELLEDLGTRTLRDAAAEATVEERRALYSEACRLVPRLQRLEDPEGRIPAFGRRLDAAHFAYKADFFVRWSLPGALGRPARAAEAEVVRQAFALVAAESAAAPARLAHRDLQSANVLLRPGAPPGERLVLIDLQGAFLAPPEYDLVCLLRDSYVELPDEEIAFHLAWLRPLLPDAPAPESYARRFDLLTLTRKGKDHAVFLYAAERGDPSHLRFVATTVRHLRAAAAHTARLDPRLARLAELVAALPESPCGR